MNTLEAPDSSQGLEIHGISDVGDVYWNLDSKALLEHAVSAGDGVLTSTGAFSCETGEHTGRSPNDKFTVKDENTEAMVDWGKVNKPMSPEHFNRLRNDQLQYLKGKNLYVREALAGADKPNQIKIRVINESAWHNLFAKHLFIRPTPAELANHDPQFTIIHTPKFNADPEKHGTNSGTFIVVNFSEGLVLIGGTSYAGEMKKSIFSILNYIYPLRGIMAMHCSANVSAADNENVAVFFGLSGTGKTTLSADPRRNLIGDDEHGWGERGVFNFEGGCYAKTIDLTEEKEPEIYRAIRDGAILENVVVDTRTGEPDYFDGSLTQNTRAAYPIEHIDNAVLGGCGGQPKNVVFLTCDAFGVMPPISKLNEEQAMYHFLSGYTAKVAGTEKGMGASPEATFSACFGAPFLPLKPAFYAEMLGERVKQHNADCWLINTGWVGGGYGVGERIKLRYTRRMVEAALSGDLAKASFKTHPVFGVGIPEAITGVPSELLNPREVWQDKAAYDKQADELARLFEENFKQFGGPNDLKSARPKAVS